MNIVSLCNDRDNIIVFAKERLNDEQQQVFVEHFMLSFTSHTDEFPISSDQAIEWLGYKTKHRFKDCVIKNLVEDIDYKIVFSASGENLKNLGGRPLEIFKISIDGYYTLEMKARTEKGIIVRSYYKQLEKIVYAFGLNQQQKLLEEANRKIEEANQRTKNVQYALEAEKANTARQFKRNVNVEEMCDVVYLYQESIDVIKVGESCNALRREGDHRSSTSNSRVVYTKKCTNHKLLEKVVHHILDQYRIDLKREWFKVSFEIAKEALDCAQLFLDGLVDKCDTIHSKNLFEQFNTIIQELDETPRVMNELLEESEDESDEEEEEEFVPNIKGSNEPLDFDKFIDECCEKGDKLTVFSVDVFGAHRLWGRCCSKPTKDAFYKYLIEKYKRAKIFDPKTQSTLASYRGISLKPITYLKDNPPSDIDSFIEEKCSIGYSLRVSTKNICAAFEKWKNETSDPDYKMCTIEKKRIDGAFSTKFVPACVFTGKQGDYGYFCVELKDAPSTVGLKLAPTMKKPVIKIDMRTNQIVERYDSLTAAAKVIGKSPCYVSVDIRFKKPTGNFIYQFAEKKK